MHQTYAAPKYWSDNFHCPHCATFAHQHWSDNAELYCGGTHESNTQEFSFARCVRCGEYSVWKDAGMIFPEGGAAPLPNPDLPQEIQGDFLEARAIVGRSPRGAAALLRLALQKLCKELGEPGKDINTDIGSLVKKGLNPLIQQSLDAVRVIGNEAVHPGQIDLRDQPEIAQSLFQLVNIIADALITHPKHIAATYATLPAGKLAGIVARDAPKP